VVAGLQVRQVSALPEAKVRHTRCTAAVAVVVVSVRTRRQHHLQATRSRSLSDKVDLDLCWTEATQRSRSAAAPLPLEAAATADSPMARNSILLSDLASMPTLQAVVVARAPSSALLHREARQARA